MDCGLGRFILADFMPHGFCMRWQPEVLWLHVISDGLIVLAYASIPFLLLVVARRRKDIPFHWMLPAFSAFILACGATHLMSIVTIWNPLYQLEGIFKALTAVASLVTAFGLYRLLPDILKMPSTVQLHNAHASLTLSNRELSQLADELEVSNRALQQSAAANESSEAQFRQLADSMPHIVWTAQPNGLVDYYNERWYSFTGFDRSLVGDSSWMPLLHPEDLQMVRDAWYASAQSGVSFKQEYRFWDRATQTYRWHLGQAVPVIDAQGTITKWFGGSTDIDDYKRAERNIMTLNAELESRVVERTQELSWANEELRRTQTWLQAIVHSATDVSIMVLDNDGLITFFNSGSERLLGYQSSEVVGKCTPYLLYPPEECENRARQLSEELKRPIGVDQIFLSANQPPGSFVVESVYLHNDGTQIDISLAISPMIDSVGELLGKLAIAVDMRPRKILEQQLRLNNAELQQQKQMAEHANRAKSDFLSTMSHEIRTPMNAILGMADLLWDSELSEMQRRYVEVFRRASANLLSLVNDMLDLSKIESGRFELERIEFDLNTVIQTALDIIRPSTKSKQLSLSATVAQGTPTALIGDPLRLQQVLTNLVSNAVKFTPSGSVTLTVQATPDSPRRIQFAVTDTGIGIPANKLELIFQDFTQAESSTTRRFGGTGLGLGICRRLVHRMGGTLNVRSAPGEGSTFSFDAEFELSRLPEGTHSSPEVTSLAGKRVLLVDDINTNRLIFTEMCRVWGMETTECDDVVQVLPQLRAAQTNGKPFDLIIVDMIIRDANGIDLISEIRQSYPRLPVLMTSSDQIPGDQTHVFSFGEAAYAVKPVRRSELLQLIRNLLGSAKQATVTESYPNKRARVLIADDSEDNRFLLNEYLKSGPFEIQFAANGQEAVDLAQTQRFDLILMDILMPVMDGLTATRLIRRGEQEAGMRPVPLLALTANARAEDLELSAAAGCTGHISKPVSRQLLMERVMDQIHIRPVEINIPKGLEEAAKRYLLSRKNELSTLNQLISEADFDQLRRLAHNMKGTGTAYGFPDLTRIGKLMETAAKAQRAEDLSAQLLELSRYLQDAEAVLNVH